MQVKMFRRISDLYREEMPYFQLIERDRLGFAFSTMCYGYARDAGRVIKGILKNEINDS